MDCPKYEDDSAYGCSVFDACGYETSTECPYLSNCPQHRDPEEIACEERDRWQDYQSDCASYWQAVKDVFDLYGQHKKAKSMYDAAVDPQSVHKVAAQIRRYYGGNIGRLSKHTLELAREIDGRQAIVAEAYLSASGHEYQDCYGAQAVSTFYKKVWTQGSAADHDWYRKNIDRKIRDCCEPLTLEEFAKQRAAVRAETARRKKNKKRKQKK